MTALLINIEKIEENQIPTTMKKQEMLTGNYLGSPTFLLDVGS